MIQINELMIGDWIMVKDYPTIATPTQIRNEHFVRSLVSFEPIPLIDDILKKNGFERNEHFDYNEYIFFSFPKGVTIKSGSGFGIEKRNDIYYITDHALMPMQYVHELQLALRLCKLKELANNFKI